ncbi:MAG: biopolymer transporter ExbD [Phycisphaerae bacterium]|nr:biopolymer transporter ExbD [Phycisphaerae bacterium]
MVRVHKRRRRRGRPGQRARSLNLTGTLDVAFLLLIFLVLTATFAAREGDLPGRHGPAEPGPPRLALTIDLQAPGTPGNPGTPGTPGARWIVDERVALDAPDRDGLACLLAEWRDDPERNPTGLCDKDNTLVVIRPGRRVPWDHVVQAYDAVVEARYTHISLAQAR